MPSCEAKNAFSATFDWAFHALAANGHACERGHFVGRFGIQRVKHGNDEPSIFNAKGYDAQSDCLIGSQTFDGLVLGLGGPFVPVDAK